MPASITRLIFQFLNFVANGNISAATPSRFILFNVLPFHLPCTWIRDSMLGFTLNALSMIANLITVNNQLCFYTNWKRGGTLSWQSPITTSSCCWSRRHTTLITSNADKSDHVLFLSTLPQSMSLWSSCWLSVWLRWSLCSSRFCWLPGFEQETSARRW